MPTNSSPPVLYTFPYVDKTLYRQLAALLIISSPVL